MNPNVTSVITPAHLAKAYSYAQYQQLIEGLLAQEKTTGPKQTPDLVHYTKLNMRRMYRWDKTAILNEELIDLLTSLSEPWTWVVLTEGWCGDAAQNLPVISKMANLSHNITLKLLLRDENLDVMDQYLTHGGRSIPKLICLKTRTLEELGTWGPRPEVAQQLVMAYKQNPQVSFEEFAETLHAWYAKDKTQHLQMEFTHLLQQWRQQ